MLYLSCAFPPEVCLLLALFPYPSDRGICKDKIKRLGEIHDISERQGQRTKSPLFSQSIPLLQDFYSNRQVSNNP